MDEKEFIITRINHEKRTLDNLPDFMEFERGCIEEEIQDLERKLKSMDSMPKPFQTSITFSGPKVCERHGIQTEFATSAITKYTAAVKEVGKNIAEVQRDRARQFDMMITGTMKGSFGFVLEPVSGETPTLFDNTFLEDAVKKTKEIMEAAQVDDDSVAEAIEDFSDSAIEAIHVFVKFLMDNQASCNIGIQKSKFPITGISYIEQRLNRQNIKEEEEILEGKLTGLFIQKPSFEFQIQQERITGKINQDEDSFDSLMEELKRSIEKNIQIKVHTRSVGTGKKSYILQKIENLETDQSSES